MDKFKYSFLLLLFAFFSVLAYALVKAWVHYGEQGIDLKEESVEENTQVSTPANLPSNDIVDNSKIIWKNFLYYPIEPSSEEGSFGPKKYKTHAKNLTFVNLTNGRIKKLFDKRVYIWDFFPGEFTKIPSSASIGYEESTQSENLSIDIGQRLILLVITKDTNGDGFLNQKDKLKVFIYEPNSETLNDILPEGFYFEKLLYNSKKDTLAMVVSHTETPPEKPRYSIFIYEVNTQKSILVTP